MVKCLTACSRIEVEPVGRWFEAICLRRRHKHSLSQHSLSSSSSSESEDDDAEVHEDESLLLSLDPKDWKVGIIRYCTLIFAPRVHFLTYARAFEEELHLFIINYILSKVLLLHCKYLSLFKFL